MALGASAAWVALSISTWLILGIGLIDWYLGPLPALPQVDETNVAIGKQDTESMVIPDRLGEGETLSTVLLRNGLSQAQVHDIALALSGVMDVRHLRAGDELLLSYESRRDVSSIRILRGQLQEILLTRSDVGWQSESTSIEVERRDVALAGVLEDNLFVSMARLGESAPLTIAFANVFGWDFDFHTQSRNGDRFALVVEKLYRNGEPVGYGRLKAARYESFLGGRRVFAAFHYEDPTGKSDYYDPDGKSMRKAFLRAPVEFQRISSGFSHNRLHPVHHRRMPHLGVDYVAPAGTPVFSVASGVVTDRGMRGPNGNMVTVRHQMGYTTKYLHLSRFAKGLRVGQRVEQRQVIGYVGSTGTATGAHLDFRLIRHGTPVNPLTQIYPPGPPVADEFRGDFEALKARLERELGPRRVAPVTIAADE
jgi:murein DD-endopeptidase MepM/ murein hydrolase activator NlpD